MTKGLTDEAVEAISFSNVPQDAIVAPIVSPRLAPAEPAGTSHIILTFHEPLPMWGVTSTWAPTLHQ